MMRIKNSLLVMNLENLLKGKVEILAIQIFIPSLHAKYVSIV